MKSIGHWKPPFPIKISGPLKISGPRKLIFIFTPIAPEKASFALFNIWYSDNPSNRRAVEFYWKRGLNPLGKSFIKVTPIFTPPLMAIID
jgi:hypothetical protein